MESNATSTAKAAATLAVLGVLLLVLAALSSAFPGRPEQGAGIGGTLADVLGVLLLLIGAGTGVAAGVIHRRTTRKGP